MDLPDYWLSRPAPDLDDEARRACGQLLAQATAAGPETAIDYTLAIPRWRFLCYAGDEHGLALHGTGDPGIRLFEPREANDLSDFGRQTAVYAAGDGLWAMFFAIVDRTGHALSVSNACVRLAGPDGQVSEPRYVFSVSQEALPQRPWRRGSVYLLPGETFVTQPPLTFGPYEVRIPQLASLVAVRPLARLEIEPEDFPFLADIRGHDDARLAEYGQAMQTGAPWPE
ncbi:MAG: hypothetical protein IT318_21600 [Anaerolineales bacterium]|nr:hypothetical protein [Anaerolineales bacterium]